ncbi:hypothetical protein PsorP6_015426 [Peronosclerospora sorghi]|uniref:Uncharacterized protein n=1 Tax=Peronosclerospora sorghi TaxID=230839 RepID=A0ACC0WMX9_9STRA|nr:hypothetical protein PsorP6_015426 [Peronosclerospora sorghi]
MALIIVTERRTHVKVQHDKFQLNVISLVRYPYSVFELVQVERVRLSFTRYTSESGANSASGYNLQRRQKNFVSELLLVKVFVAKEVQRTSKDKTSVVASLHSSDETDMVPK